MNIECDQDVRDEIETAFRFNDAVIRNLILKRDEAITDMSILAKSKDEADAADKRSAAAAAAAAESDDDEFDEVMIDDDDNIEAESAASAE